MQRFLSVLLLAIVGYLPISPLVVAGTGSDQPACCRKDGKHHCLLGSSSAVPLPASGKTFGVSAKCEMYPVSALSDVQVFNGSPEFHSFTLLPYFHPAGTPQAEARFRATLSRGWQKRGPPSFLLT